MKQPLQLNLTKAAAGLVLSLQKRGINIPPPMELAFNLDVSGSFRDEHQDGLTQGLLTRLVPWGMVFDHDKKMDVFTFSDGASHAYYVGEITENDHDGYIARCIINKVPGYNGGTDYAHVLRKNLAHFGYGCGNQTVAKPQGGGMLGRLFGGGAKPVAEPVVTTTQTKKRALVIHVTDGDNNGDDKEPTRRLLRESAERGDQVYYLFIGCSNQPSTFRYIEQLGDEFPNVGLVVIRDIEKFVHMTDEEVNEQLIGDELLEWLKK